MLTILGRTSEDNEVGLLKDRAKQFHTGNSRFNNYTLRQIRRGKKRFLLFYLCYLRCYAAEKLGTVGAGGARPIPSLVPEEGPPRRGHSQIHVLSRPGRHVP